MTTCRHGLNLSRNIMYVHVMKSVKCSEGPEKLCGTSLEKPQATKKSVLTINFALSGLYVIYAAYQSITLFLILFMLFSANYLDALNIT